MRKYNSIAILNIVALSLCLFSWEYSVYNFLRFFITIFFCLLSFHAFNRKNITEAIVNLSLLLLFQPFFKVYLTRELWLLVDLIAIGFTIYTQLTYLRTNSKST